MLDRPISDPIFLEDLEVGMSRQRSKVFSDEDLHRFAEISTDCNPVHLDDAYAKASMFHGRICHGMLTASLISAVIGEQLPGHGTIYLGQTLKFLAPVRPGQEVTARVTVTAIEPTHARVTLETTCSVGDTVVLKGEATVLAPSRRAA